jgi:hypothetical protein
MTRSTFLLIVLSACSPARPQTTLHVRSDHGCVGVVGFSVTIAGTDPAERVQMRTMPVLSEDACTLDQSITVPDVGVDTPLSVTIAGYDSQRFERVFGTADVGTLDAPGQTTILLASRWDPVKQVLLVHRAQDLGIASLGDVTDMVIKTPPNATLLLLSVTDQVRAFFVATEPGAFTIDPLVPLQDLQDVTVTVTTTGGSLPPVKLIAHDRGAYFEAAPR